jgi:hypothetical protein
MFIISFFGIYYNSWKIVMFIYKSMIDCIKFVFKPKTTHKTAIVQSLYGKSYSNLLYSS